MIPGNKGSNEDGMKGPESQPEGTPIGPIWNGVNIEVNDSNGYNPLDNIENHESILISYIIKR